MYNAQSTDGTRANRLVAQVSEYIPSGERTFDLFLLGLSRRLFERGWSVLHVFPGHPPRTYVEALRNSNSNYIVADLPLSGQKQAYELGRRLARFNPLTIQTHFLSIYDRTLPMLKLASGARALIVTDHTSGRTRQYTTARNIAAKARAIAVVPFVNHVVAVSRFVRDRDVDGGHFPVSRISVVYNGVDPDRYHPPTSRPRSDRFRIVFAGRLISGKGVISLLEAGMRLVASGIPLEIRIAGEGPQRAEIERFIEHSTPRLEAHLVGQLGDTQRLFSLADVVVVPSNYGEAFGLVAIEAMATGCCVVAAGDGGLPETVGSDNVSGFLFPPGDVDALEGILKMLYERPDLRRTVGLAARRRILDHFTLGRMIEGHADAVVKTSATWIRVEPK